MTSVHAVVQAGGRGERLRPLTDTTPKPLLPVAGVPMIERLVRQLGTCGVPTVTVVTAWLGDLVEAHLRPLADIPELSFVREQTPLGTLGALGLVTPRADRTLFLFADLVTDLDFRQLLAVHLERSADLTLASHREGHRLRLGEIESDGDRVTGYSEKPEKLYTICSGIAMLESGLTPLVDGPAGFPDLVNSAVRAGHTVTHWEHGAFWLDVNSPAALADASEEVAVRSQLSAEPSVVGDRLVRRSPDVVVGTPGAWSDITLRR
jgi:NDP-sugar pyrophosphorylase family protein